MPQEPANTPPPIPEPIFVPEKKSPHTVLIFAVVFVVVFIIVALSYAAYTDFFGRFQGNPPSSESELQTAENSQFHSNTENIKFTLPLGWTFNSDLELALPKGFKDLSLGLEKTGTACVIMIVAPNREEERVLKQISWATRIFSDYHQYDGRWYVASSSESAHYVFSEYDRQYIPGELRESSGGDHSFLLLMKDGAAVPDACNSDLDELLQTIEPYYEQVKLDARSKGTLVRAFVRDDQGMDTEDDSYKSLVFLADGSEEKKEVVRLPDGASAEPFSVIKDKLYVQANSHSYHFDEKEPRGRFDAAIYMIDPFSGQATVVAGSAMPDSYISSIYIKNQTIYYLAGDSALGTCVQGYGPCPANLYSIPLAGGNPTFITKTSVGGSLWGYVESEQALYLGRSSGDAGCVGYTVSKVVSGKEEFVGKYSACVGDITPEGNSAYEEMKETVDAIKEKAAAARTTSKALRVEDGIFSPAEGGPLDYASFYFYK